MSKKFITFVEQMNEDRKNRFKELLSVPSKTYQEEMMVDYISQELDKIEGVSYYRDEMLNIYATKGVLDEGEHYPMFMAHTDTVHSLVNEIVVVETKRSKPNTFGMKFDDTEYDVLEGNTTDGLPTGIGGDDKCGVFICLELLKDLPKLKVGFFVSEETGCHGSSKCDPHFLSDIGYAIQYDAPGDGLITEICSGINLFDANGDFIERTLPIFEEVMGVKPLRQSHPYTDVSQIKKKTDVSCINFSCGYYNMHKPEEFIVLDDVDRAYELGLRMVEEFGYNKSVFEYQIPNYTNFFTTPMAKDDLNMETESGLIFDSVSIKMTEDFDGVIIEDKFYGTEIFVDDEELEHLFEYLKTKYEY